MSDPTGPGSEDRAAAVARAAQLVSREDAEAHAALTRPAKGRRGLVVVAWVLFAVNVVGWLIVPPPPLDSSDQRLPAEIERDLRLSIAGTASDIESWRSANGGRLPTSLEVAGLGDRGLEYVRVDSISFRLVGADGPVRLSYDSKTPPSEFVVIGTKP